MAGAGEAGVLCDEDLWEPPSPRTAPERVATPRAPAPAGAGLPAQACWEPFGRCGRGSVEKRDGMTQLGQKHLWSKDKAFVGSALMSCLCWDVNRLSTGMCF